MCHVLDLPLLVQTNRLVLVFIIFSLQCFFYDIEFLFKSNV